MSQSPPALLVRLREADVVRLCGLEAAAQGMELAARHSITHARREQGRLSATVVQDGVSQLVWADFSGETVRWGCDGHARAATAGAPDAPGDPSGGAIPALGCVHVAALLSAWLRQPADFAAPAAPAPPPPPAAETPPMRGEQAAVPHSAPASSLAQLTQPRLLRPPSRQRGAPTLADELARLPAAELAGIARRVLQADPPPPEHEARTLLAAALRSQAVVAPLIARLDPAARALLADLALLGGALTAADLDAMAARSGRAPGALRAEVAVLARHGLVFAAPALARSDADGERGPTGRSWRAVAGWRIPAELRAALPPALSIAPAAARGAHGPPLLAPPPLPSAAGAAASPAPMVTNTRAAVTRAARVLHASPRRLMLALALLPHAPPPYNPLPAVSPAGAANSFAVTVRANAGAPTGGVVRAPLPLVPGDLPPLALAELARGLGVPPGLAQLARRVLLWSRDGASDYPLVDLVRVPAEERPRALRAAFRLWRAAEQPAELADLALPGSPVLAAFDAHHPALRPAALAAEALGARAFLLALGAAAEPGAWYQLADLLDLVWRVYPLFLRGRQSAHAAPAWWLRTPREARPLRAGVHDEWLAAEGSFIRAFCEGPLVWWGLLDCAYTREGPLYAVRVTALGRYLLGLDEALPADVTAALATADATAPVLPTREGTLAVQPLAAGAALLDTLDGWAHVAAVAGGRLVYALSAERACVAFDRDFSPEPLLAQLRTLDARHDTRTATALAPRLEAWRAEYGASRIERGWTLLEARDEPTLVEALAVLPALSERCRRLAPAVALIPQADAPALAAALAKRGYQL